MNRLSLSLTVLCAPALMLGTISCSSVGQTKARLAEWKEKKEEQRLAREVAQAEKEMAEEAERSGQVASTGMEASIFLDYSNPGGSVAGGGAADTGVAPFGAGPALPGSELPMVVDAAGYESGAATGGEPIFLGDVGGAVAADAEAPPRVDADLVRAWAASISPLMGASLTEPLITAAMTAQVTPTETAVAAHAAATDSAPLASAFAGQPARSNLRLTSSELEHE